MWTKYSWISVGKCCARTTREWTILDGITTNTTRIMILDDTADGEEGGGERKAPRAALFFDIELA